MMNKFLLTARYYVSAFIMISFCTIGNVYADQEGLWLSGGQNLNNTRHQSKESKIDPTNAASLSPKWIVNTGGDVSATPAVDGKHVYVPDFAGNLFKVELESGTVVWQRQISEYTGIPGDFSRTTPAVYDDLLIFGNQAGRFYGPGATVMAVNKKTGDAVWVQKVEEHPSAFSPNLQPYMAIQFM